MDEGEMCADKDEFVPNSTEEIRLRRLAYFENVQKVSSPDQVKAVKQTESVHISSGKESAEIKSTQQRELRQTENVQIHSGKAAGEKKSSPATDSSGKAKVKKTTEFHVQASSTRTKSETRHSINSSRSEVEEIVSYEVYKISKKPAESTGASSKNTRHGSTSSLSGDEGGCNPPSRVSQPVTKPASSDGTPQISQRTATVQSSDLHADKDGGKLADERSYRITRSVRISGDSEVESLFSNRRWVSANEIPSLSLRDSADVDVSAFKSSANFDDLGLSTHRPENTASTHDIFDRRRVTRQRSLSSENLLVGSRAEEIKTALGEQKYRELVEKSEHDLSLLHSQKFKDHPHTSVHLNGDIRFERLSRKDSPVRNTSTPPPQTLSPLSSSSGRRGPSPRRRLRSSSPQTVSRTFQDVARLHQARDITSSRNYEQVVVPHNTTFSADEIYRQAYGGNSGSGSDRTDVHKSSSSLASSYHEGASSFWSGATPRQMAGLVSPTSTHTSPAFPGPFHAVSTSGSMHTAMQIHHPVYQNSGSGPGYMYSHPQGVPMSPGSGGQYAYPVQQSMFMPVTPGTPPSDPFIYHHHHGHPMSHSMPSFHTGNLPSPVGSPWQHFTQYPPPHWSQYMASGERNNSYSGPPGWQEGTVPMMVPQPPSSTPGRVSDQQEGRSYDYDKSHDDPTARHAKAVRQFHEHKHHSPGKQNVRHSQNPDFTSASLEWYFTSLGMAPPSYPPPSYHLHAPPNQPLSAERRQTAPRSAKEKGERGADVCGSEEEDTLVERHTSDDNMTTVTNTSITTGTSIKAEGITERMKALGVDPLVLQQLKRQTEMEAADEETLEAMKNLVRVCPECQAVNKEYMTWCLHCGGVLIGVEAIPARSLKKKNKQKETVAASSSAKSKTVDSVDETPSHKHQERYYNKQDAVEPWADYTEKEDDNALADETCTQEQCDDQDEASHYIAFRDFHHTRDQGIEEDISETKESPESGKEPSATSSPARKAGQDNIEDSEDPSQDTLEVTENRDSGRPSSGEEADTRKAHSQPVADRPPQRTQKEISDICEVISDPIIRGFIKNYLQKRPGQDQVTEKDWPVGGADSIPQQKLGKDNKANKLSNSLALDLGASISTTVAASVAIQNMNSKGVQSSQKKKSQRKNSKGKGHEAIDIEIFGIEEAKLCRSARSSANIVPMLNLVHSSDEEDDSSDKTSSNAHGGASTTEHSEANSVGAVDEAELLEPVNYDKEVKAIAAQYVSKTSHAYKLEPSAEDAGNKAKFLQHLVESESSAPGPQPPRKNGQSRQQQQQKSSPVSKVRASMEAPAQNRRWARSSIAWSSYHPRELNTRSSLNLARGGGRAPSSANVRASQSTDNLTNSSQSQPEFLPSQRQRPASADQHNRRATQFGRPASAGRGGHPYSAQVPSPAQSWQQVESHDSVGDQQPPERTRQRSSLDNGTIPSPRFPESADHRLPMQDNTLPLIPTGPSTALQIYDRCTELTPRIQEGVLSKWLCLPDELWLHVFSYLPQSDLFRAALTCKQLYRIALDDTLWKYLTVKKKTLSAEWLRQIAQRHPVSLALVQCHGENIDSDNLRELFREVAPHLKELNFSRCSRGILTGDNILLHASARCRSLTHVDASWCHVTDNGLSALAECCHRLESLCLNGCQMITDESLEAVLKKHGQSLHVLELFGCFGLTQSGFRSLATYCTFLLTLNIGQCHKVTDSCVATLSASLGRVENLDLRGCKQIKDNCIRKIVRNCPRLRMLTLANCPSISDSAIVEIATYSTDIRVLDVCGCRNITDNSIRTLANNCSRLTSIDISSTSCTHKSALLLASYGRCLECVKFNFLPDITEACLFKLIKNCKRLNTIHLYGCNNIRDVSRLKMLNCFMHIEM